LIPGEPTNTTNITPTGNRLMNKDEIEALREARSSQMDVARQDIVTRVHGTGKMTARERVDLLLDSDSAVEYGSIAAKTEQGTWVAETGGVDFVGTVDGHPVITSSTDYTDHGGGYGAGRLGRLFGLAFEQRWPVVLFADGGGSRARHPRVGMGHIETSGPIGRFSFLDGVPELSGWAPVVAIVSGPSFAGHASIAGFSDFLISTPGSSIGMGGPPMVEAALGQRLRANELAGAEMHETGGGIDLLVDDEQAAIAAARRYLSYYWSTTNSDDQVSTPARPGAEHGSEAGSKISLDDIAPSGDETFDMQQIITGICDADSVFELRPQFARSVITALARIEGNTVGVLANQPLVNDGAIDQPGATKISRFVELCNTYEYPMLSLIDTPGCVTNWNLKGQEETTEAGLTRWHARPLIAHQQRTVPLFSVQIRRGRGLGAALMTGVSSTRGVPAIRLGWPGVEIGRRDGFSAAVDHNSFDDVITPGETRDKIARLLRLMPRKLDQSEKKHIIDMW
jgi:acetyl-CoA carboxylase carboxyltransferase component